MNLPETVPLVGGAILAAGIIFLVLWATIYQNLAKTLNDYCEARGVLASCLRLRKELNPDLNQLLRLADKKDKTYQLRILSTWERVNQTDPSPTNTPPGPLAPLHNMMARGGPKVTANIPERKAEDTRIKLMGQIENVETRIGAAERMVESTVREHNNALCGILPAGVAWFHGFRPLNFTSLTEELRTKQKYDFGN